MAAKNPVIGHPVADVVSYFWENITENDTATPLTVGGMGPAVGSIQITGTHGGATTVLQGSNDGSTWVTLNDLAGDPISFSSAVGAADFSTAMLYLRVSCSGGSSQDLDFTLVMRGEQK